MNPRLAEQYGVTDGDWCEVYNMFGEARFKAEIDSDHEAWHPELRSWLVVP